MVEKALRGEVSSTAEGFEQRDDSDLLREWFDLMRDRTELRRYEKELLVRAQELELEDRHARLQQELRERLAGDGKNYCKDSVTCRDNCFIFSAQMKEKHKMTSLLKVPF